MVTCRNCGACQEPFDICRNCKGKGNYGISIIKKKQKNINKPKKVGRNNDKHFSNQINKDDNIQPKLGKKYLKELSRYISRMLKKDVLICEECGVEGLLQVHHIDKNPFNNSIDNLVKLCLKHHKQKHIGDVVHRIMK